MNCFCEIEKKVSNIKWKYTVKQINYVLYQPSVKGNKSIIMRPNIVIIINFWLFYWKCIYILVLQLWFDSEGVNKNKL